MTPRLAFAGINLSKSGGEHDAAPRHCSYEGARPAIYQMCDPGPVLSIIGVAALLPPAPRPRFDGTLRQVEPRRSVAIAARLSQAQDGRTAGRQAFPRTRGGKPAHRGRGTGRARQGGRAREGHSQASRQGDGQGKEKLEQQRNLEEFEQQSTHHDPGGSGTSKWGLPDGADLESQKGHTHSSASHLRSHTSLLLPRSR